MGFIKRRVHGKAIKIMVVADRGERPHLLGHGLDPTSLRSDRAGCDLFASATGADRTYV